MKHADVSNTKQTEVTTVKVKYYDLLYQFLEVCFYHKEKKNLHVKVKSWKLVLVLIK